VPPFLTINRGADRTLTGLDCRKGARGNKRQPRLGSRPYPPRAGGRSPLGVERASAARGKHHPEIPDRGAIATERNGASPARCKLILLGGGFWHRNCKQKQCERIHF